MNSFANTGPGDMSVSDVGSACLLLTFSRVFRLGLISSESYATPVRGTLYGFSAAVGKTGAVLSTQSFQPIRTNLGPRWTFVSPFDT